MPTRWHWWPICPAAGKTIGLVDVPGRRFTWTVWDTGEVFLGDFSGAEPVIRPLGNAGKNPFDAVLTEDAHTYLVGLFGEKGVTAFDLWDENPKPLKFLRITARRPTICRSTRCRTCKAGPSPKASTSCLPLARMNCCGWTATAAGNRRDTAVHGQPVFIIAQPA